MTFSLYMYKYMQISITLNVNYRQLHTMREENKDIMFIYIRIYKIRLSNYGRKIHVIR